MLVSSMTIPASRRFIWCVNNPRLLTFIVIYCYGSKTQFVKKIKAFRSDGACESFGAFSFLKAPFISSHALTCINKMVLLRGNIIAFLRLLILFLSRVLCGEHIGQRSWSLLSTLSTVPLPPFYLGECHMSSFSLLLLRIVIFRQYDALASSYFHLLSAKSCFSVFVVSS